MRKVIAIMTLVAGALALSGCRPDAARVARNERWDQLAERLGDAWEITLVLDPPLGTDPSAPAPEAIEGTMTFTPNRHGVAVHPLFGPVTNKGVYDIDLTPFGIRAEDGSGSATALAYVAPTPAIGRIVPEDAADDSVSIVLDPTAAGWTMRLQGLLRHDSISGHWRAQYLRSGSEGHFSMHRRSAVR
jgi:hypothetical protein